MKNIREMASIKNWRISQSFVKTVVLVFAVAVCTQTFFDVYFSSSRDGFDFTLRYNEVECLKAGVNPFDVWSGRVHHETYFRFDSQSEPGQTKSVHAYPPWEYTYFLPLSCFSLKTASRIFFVMEVLALAIVIRFMFTKGYSIRKSSLDGLFVVSCGLFLGAATESAFWEHQFGIVNLAVLIALFAALKHGRQIAAGVCWAFLMTKPQVGLPLFIPLFLNRRFKAIGTAVAVCLVATIPPSLYCGESPIHMILSLRESAYGILGRTTICPRPIFSFLANSIHPDFPAIASGAIGLGLCGWLSWRFRKAGSWYVRFLPAILCSTAWSYLQIHDKTLFLFLQVAVAMCIVIERDRLRRIALLAIVFCSACSLGYYFHSKTKTWIHEHMGLTLPQGLPSQLLYATYISGSFVQYVLYSVFLFWIAKSPERLEALDKGSC